ncbi:hypothetical protein [Streptosporangium sp. NPDC001681]|uniref:hypothetical protein n=1 Tax=Streptosporangium sp. NPDC001681 TaxID=3154395 RepID=UPI00332D3EA0
MTTKDNAASPPAADDNQARKVAVRKIAWRQRHAVVNLLPLAWMAGLQSVAALIAVAAVVPWVKVAAVFVAIASVLIWLERRGGSPYAAALVAGVLWLIPAYLWGPFGWTALTLWLAGPLVAAPFLREHQTRFRHRPEPKQPAIVVEEPKPELEAGPAPEQVKYNELVIPNNPVFAGTRLDTPEAVPGGFVARIIGEPGKTELSKLETGKGTVASAWRGRPDQVTIEETPEGDNSQAMLTVITRGDNLQQIRYLEDDGAGIDVRTGIARVGYFNDLRPAHWSWWTASGGAQMGCNCGTTGTGKSGFGGLKICLAHGCPLIATVLLDAQDGSSQPDWNNKTHRYGEGVEQVFAELQALDYVAGRRAHYISHAQWSDSQGRERIGKPYLLPGDPDLGGMVLIYVPVEEAPLLFQDEVFGPRAIKLLAPGSKTYRKPGISLDIYTQNLDLGELGRSRAFRANISGGGSIAAFRTGTSTDHKMVGLASDPSKLPEYFPNGAKTHGLGYLRGLDRRQATMRTLIPRDQFAIASRPASGRFDDITLGFYDEYAATLKSGRKAAAVQAAPVRATSGDVQAALEEALAAADGPLDLGSIVAVCGQRIQGCSLGEIKAGLAALEAAGLVWRSGSTYSYVDEGR